MEIYRKYIRNLVIGVVGLIFLTPLYSNDPTIGLILNDETKSFDGYVLFGPKTTTTTYLIDNDGNLINKWETEYQPASTAYLLEDGNLLRSTKLIDPSGGNGGFQVLDWEGNVVWGYTYGPQHHDIEPLPNGNVLLITNDEKDSTTAIDAGFDPNDFVDEVKSLTILEIANNNGTGEIVWQWNAWDHLVQDFDQTKPNFGTVSEHPELINLNWIPNPNNNWIHPNSIDYNEEFDQIMISSRTFNELWVIDHSTTTEEAATHSGGQSGKGGDILYRWGNPVTYGRGDADDQLLFGQHDAQWIEPGLPGAGNITTFNNGLNRPAGAFSSIDEIAPPVDNSGNYTITTGLAFEPSVLTWTYIAAEPTDMYSSKFSGAHRLPNGNTLICNGVGGELIEVTSAGEIVWKYVNPESTNGILTQGDTPDKNDVFRAHKYAPDYPGFAGKDLTPGSVIEYLEVNDYVGTPTQFKLNGNYPNPFNPSTKIEFELSEAAFVTLVIYDIVGNKVRELLSERMELGIQSVTWDALDDYGNLVSSGMYFYTISDGQVNQTKKMMLLR